MWSDGVAAVKDSDAWPTPDDHVTTAPGASTPLVSLRTTGPANVVTMWLSESCAVIVTGCVPPLGTSASATSTLKWSSEPMTTKPLAFVPAAAPAVAVTWSLFAAAESFTAPVPTPPDQDSGVDTVSVPVRSVSVTGPANAGTGLPPPSTAFTVTGSAWPAFTLGSPTCTMKWSRRSSTRTGALEPVEALSPDASVAVITSAKVAVATLTVSVTAPLAHTPGECTVSEPDESVSVAGPGKPVTTSLSTSSAVIVTPKFWPVPMFDTVGTTRKCVGGPTTVMSGLVPLAPGEAPASWTVIASPANGTPTEAVTAATPLWKCTAPVVSEPARSVNVTGPL